MKFLKIQVVIFFILLLATSCAKHENDQATMNVEGSEVLNSSISNRNKAMKDRLLLMIRGLACIAKNEKLNMFLREELYSNYSPDFTIPLGELDNALTAKGYSLSKMLTISMKAANYSEFEIRMVIELLTGFQINDSKYKFELFFPFLDSSVFNHSVNPSLEIKYVAAIQLFDENALPAISLSNEDVKKMGQITEIDAMSNSILFVSISSLSSKVNSLEDGDLNYRFLAKCYCHIVSAGYACEEGGSSTAVIGCGRKAFGSCWGGSDCGN